MGSVEWILKRWAIQQNEMAKHSKSYNLHCGVTENKQESIHDNLHNAYRKIP